MIIWSQAAENIGMAMIYTLTTALQDRIIAITELGSTESERKEKEKLDEERRKEDVRSIHYKKYLSGNQHA